MCLLLLVTISLSMNAQEPAFLSTCKQVADKKGDLIVCDGSKLKEVITIPLSAFTEELQIVKLDDADDALVKETSVEVGEKYFLIKGQREIPFKLFEKKTGKFVANIGAFGQGPGEYQNIYDQQLDEENNRIYLLPWSTKQLLVYDLQGNSLPPIPLCFGAPKGHFKVDTKAATVIVSALPFEGQKAVVWQQTLTGELLKSVEPGHLSVPRDFSNEMGVYKNGTDYIFNVFTFEPRPDSVYRYDITNNTIIPVFTMDFKIAALPIHSYTKNNRYYFGDYSEPKKLTDNLTTTQNHQYYFVDKKTLKGSFFNLKNDFLGDLDISYAIYAISGDYYVHNADPGNLKDDLEKILEENKKMTPEMRKKLTKLKDSITENDNNYILYAKIKK